MKAKKTFAEDRGDLVWREAMCFCGHVTALNMDATDGGLVVFEGACENCGRHLVLKVTARPQRAP